MRILIITHQYFPEYTTGTEQFVYRLAHQLQDRNEIIVLSLNRHSDSEFESEQYQHDGIQCHRFGTNKKNDLPALQMAYNTSEYKYVENLIDHFSPDLVHFAHTINLAFITNILAKKNIPYTLTLTDYWLLCQNAIMTNKSYKSCQCRSGYPYCAEYQFDSNVAASRLFDSKYILRNARAIVSPSAYLKNIFEYAFPDLFINNPIIHIRHGYDIDEKQRKVKKNNSFAYHGSFGKHKGISLLIKAYDLAKKQVNMPPLDLYGDLYGSADLDDKTKARLISGDDLKFAGFYQIQDTQQVISKYKFVVIPSIWEENSPISMISALACGVPVIAARIGGIPEIINERNGFLYNPNDINDLARALMKAAKVNDGDYQGMVENCEWLQSETDEARSYEQLFRKMVAN